MVLMKHRAAVIKNAFRYVDILLPIIAVTVAVTAKIELIGIHWYSDYNYIFQFYSYWHNVMQVEPVSQYKHVHPWYMYLL